jgi:hypothetical protein
MIDRPDDAAADRGALRASHADREQVIRTLKAAYVQGRLWKPEFDQRVSQTFAARTYADLANVTADLPAGIAGAEPPPDPETTKPPVNKPLLWAASVIVVWALALLAIAFPAENVGLATLGVLSILIAGPIAGTLVIDLRHEQRPRSRHLPPGSGQPGPGAGDAGGGTPELPQNPAQDRGPRDPGQMAPYRVAGERRSSTPDFG